MHSADAGEARGGRWPAARRLARRHWPWLLLALPLGLLAYILVLLPLTPGIGNLRKAKTEAPSVLVSADGKQLAAYRRTNRDWVALKDISPHVIDALIATEDRRFREHHGIDFTRTAAAALRTAGGDRQGGSTLTQQLARNLYPEDIGRAPTLTRKAKEAITALKIERAYTKDEILETYLNTVPFLYNAWGIEMAARTYFDKPAAKLDVLESATLIGMLKGTAYYNPVQNPERATQRRNVVLGQMARFGGLEAASLEQLKKQPLKVDFARQDEELGPTPHLAQQLRRWLIDWADRNGYDIHADGLVVRTTIDSRLQQAANQAVERQMDKLQATASADWGSRAWAAHRDLLEALVRESQPFKAAQDQGATQDEALKRVLADADAMKTLREDKTRLAAGFMAMDPRTGEIRAWVGSRDYALDQFDHVQQARRQPGSTFKPFVYGAAFEQGARPGDLLVDREVEIAMGDGSLWKPTDGGPPSGRVMTLREGIAYSKNTITAQLMQGVGPQRVAALARAMGVRQSKLDEVMSLALGTSPVTLREMVSAYGTIANGGNFIEPWVVARIEDREGRVLEGFQPAPPQPAVSNATAQMLVDAMRGVIEMGTGTAIRTRFGIQADVAGKTGTTQDNTDGWFMLMHPQLVAGAWVGFNDSRVTMRDAWGQGARSALPVVGDFFQVSLRARWIDPQARFATPEAEQGVLDPLLGRVNQWLSNVFSPPANDPTEAAVPPQQGPDPFPTVAAPAQPARQPQVVVIQRGRVAGPGEQPPGPVQIITVPGPAAAMGAPADAPRPSTGSTDVQVSE